MYLVPQVPPPFVRSSSLPSMQASPTPDSRQSVGTGCAAYLNSGFTRDGGEAFFRNRLRMFEYTEHRVLVGQAYLQYRRRPAGSPA